MKPTRANGSLGVGSRETLGRVTREGAATPVRSSLGVVQQRSRSLLSRAYARLYWPLHDSPNPAHRRAARRLLTRINQLDEE